jgi:hypothetical protein
MMRMAGIDPLGQLVQPPPMSIAEIKAEAQRLPASEVQHLAAFFHHLSRRSDPAYAASLDAAADAAARGDRVTLAEVRRLDASLRQSGL